MRTTAIRCAIAALFPIFAVSANAATQDILLTATVPTICSVNGSDNPTTLTGTVQINPNGTVNETPLTFDINVRCNAEYIIALTSLKGGLRNTTNSNFAIFYNASLTNPAENFAQLTPTILNSQNPRAESRPITQTDEHYQLTVAPQIAPTLLSGAYEDTLRVEIIPAM